MSEKLCHTRDFGGTAGMLEGTGSSISMWQDAQSLYNAMDPHGEVFTVKTPFVGCEVRRPMLSMAMLEEKGLHLTVGDGCQKLGGHGREIIPRRKGNSYLVDVEFKDGLLGCEESMLRGPPRGP